MQSHTAVVIGDLTLDVTWRSDETTPYQNAAGGDITIAGAPEYHIGGTAYLFAKALRDLKGPDPLIVSAVGFDPIGDSVINSLLEAGFSCEGVQRIADEKTCLVSTTYLADKTRLMVRPTTHAGRRLEAKTVQSSLAKQRGVQFLFVSGYMLVDKHSKSAAAVRSAAQLARQNEVPIVVDLVPHEFMESVGPLEEVEERLEGQATVYIAELRTIRGLGICSQLAGTQPLRDQLRAAASALAESVPVAIAQCQVGDGTYGQFSMDRSGAAKYDELTFDPASRLGMGDRLAIRRLLDPSLSLDIYAKRSDRKA